MTTHPSRIALVTGGTRGIGRAISEMLAEAGYKVIANYAGNDEKAKAFCDETGITCFKFDVSDFAACRDAVAEITETFGPIDVLVNNAGITRDRTLHKMERDCWDDVIDTNLGSCFNMCRLVIDPMNFAIVAGTTAILICIIFGIVAWVLIFRPIERFIASVSNAADDTLNAMRYVVDLPAQNEVGAAGVALNRLLVATSDAIADANIQAANAEQSEIRWQGLFNESPDAIMSPVEYRVGITAGKTPLPSSGSNSSASLLAAWSSTGSPPR